MIQDNAIDPNCAKRGRCEIAIAAGLNDVIVENNSFTPNAAEVKAVRVEAGYGGVCFFGNTVRGAAQRVDDIETADSAVSFAAPGKCPVVGPSAAPINAAYHLNQPELPPWPAGG